MALKGFLSADNYTVVMIGEYDKHKRYLSFIARTYTDSTKQEILCETGYQVQAPEDQYRVVLTKDIISIPDADPGDCFIVKSCSEAPFHGMEGCIAIRGANSSQWSFETITNNGCVYVIDEDEYYQKKDGEWVLMDSPSDITPESWEAKFGAANFDAENANLMQAIYDWLKNKPEFEHATDA
jgi:hypothetical protein